MKIDAYEEIIQFSAITGAQMIELIQQLDFGHLCCS